MTYIPNRPANRTPCVRLVFECRYTRDLECAISDGPWFKWGAIPRPPDERDGWEIFDTSKADKTGWLRVRWSEQ